MKPLLALLCAILPLAACGSDPAPLVPTPTPAVETRSPEEAAALEAARAFLAAFEARDSASLGALMAESWRSGSGAEWLAEFGGTASVRVVSLSVDRPRPGPPGAIHVVVRLDVRPAQPHYPWTPGENTRVIQLISENGHWKVAALA